MITGRVLSAHEALDWGLVSRVVAHDELLATAVDVLQQCCLTAPGARRDSKRVIDQYLGLQERFAMADSLKGPETAEGFLAFRERRWPSWVPEALRQTGRL